MDRKINREGQTKISKKNKTPLVWSAYQDTKNLQLNIKHWNTDLPVEAKSSFFVATAVYVVEEGISITLSLAFFAFIVGVHLLAERNGQVLL